jgi:hypothetical protein
MTTIVFSKDRALQLDALLRSYHDHVTPLGAVKVLCDASTSRHREAYYEVFARHPWAVLCWQGSSFKEDLLALLPHEGHVVFFVDDQVFVRPWFVEELPGLSLRLGAHLKHDYNSSNALQYLPLFKITCGLDHLAWDWSTGVGAWGYPLSVDGHVFEVSELRGLLERIAFRSPNTLESALQQFILLFLDRRGTCYTMSRVVNIPWNRVQTDWINRCGEGNDADEMLGHWEEGQQIDLSQIYGVVNESVHQEFPLRLELR